MDNSINNLDPCSSGVHDEHLPTENSDNNIDDSSLTEQEEAENPIDSHSSDLVGLIGPEVSRWKYLWKHRRQMVALIPGLLILAASGMHLVWSIYIPAFSFITRTKYEIFHLVLSWFIGAIIGGLITAFLIRTTKRSCFSCISGVLIIISGILFTVLDQNFSAILGARYLGGIAHGIIFLTTVIHAGEIAANKIRGFATSSLALGITLGLMVAAAITGNLRSMTIGMSLDRLYGIVFIVLGAIASVATLCTERESPIYIIDNDRYDALEVLLRIRNEPLDSQSALDEFVELKNMVADAEEYFTFWFFSQGNIKPLLYITATRLVLVLSMLPILNFYQYFHIIAAVASMYGFLLLIAGRFIGEIFSMNLMDIFGRKLLLTISCLGCGLMLLITGYFSFQSTDTTVAVAILACLYQICLGFGLTTASITYMSESFPLPKKPFSCFVCLLAEMLLHIAIISFVYSMETAGNLSAMFLSVGIIQIVGAIIFLVVFKETKNYSLKLSIDKMKGL